MSQQKTYTFDYNLRAKDAGLVAASAAAQVGGSNKIIDLGATGRFDGVALIDLTACEVASGDESYHVEIQFSNSASFASTNVVGPVLKLGDSTVNFGSADTAATGRYELPFTNEYAGTIYRYLRVYTRVAGTVATGINYTCNIVAHS